MSSWPSKPLLHVKACYMSLCFWKLRGLLSAPHFSCGRWFQLQPCHPAPPRHPPQLPPCLASAVSISFFPSDSTPAHVPAFPLPQNIQVMGLQLENYVPDPARLQQRSWEGVIANEHTLVDMAQEFVITPLWRHAGQKAGRQGSGGQWWWRGGSDGGGGGGQAVGLLGSLAVVEPWVAEVVGTAARAGLVKARAAA